MQTTTGRVEGGMESGSVRNGEQCNTCVYLFVGPYANTTHTRLVVGDREHLTLTKAYRMRIQIDMHTAIT